MLEQVFEPLHARAVQFDHMWSVAELRLPPDEVAWLRCWFDYLTPNSAENWGSVLLSRVEGGLFATYRQMFGALLICAGAEVCREDSREDSVWPAIRSILPKSHALQRELFMSNGQPTPLTKGVISDAARALNLRHAMDIEGTQQWFVTIKLQFGFTRRGAKNRLAEWLVGLGRPIAVEYLNGEPEFPELSSSSFQSLWRVLRQYRQDLIEEVEARNTLQQNPWIKPHWIPDLLKEAKARIRTLGDGTSLKPTEAYEGEALAEEFCPITEIALEWSLGTTPRFKFQLNRTAIGDQIQDTSATELDFYIDGSRLCRWLRQADGSWTGAGHIYAEPDSERAKPNLIPRTFLVQTGSGETLVDWDFADSGLLDEVLVFDLEKGKILRAGSEWMHPNRRYAIVCDCQCQIHGCVSVETFERNGISRKVIRLGSPLHENLCVAYKDFILWQPIKRQRDQQPHFTLTVATPEMQVFSLNDRSKLVLKGLPKDARSVELLIHKKTHKLQREDTRWRTVKEVTITPELAARQRRVRVRFSSNGRTFTERPRIELNLLAAAMLRHQREREKQVTIEALKTGSTVNRSEGTAYLRIWTPSVNKKASVLEGNYRVGRLRHGKIKLQDMPGYSGELQIMDDGERYPMGIRCHDTGCVGHFLPAMLGNLAQLRLLADKPSSDVGDNGYSLFEWVAKNQRKAKLDQLPNSCVQDSSTKRLWRLCYSSNPLAIALTWKGSYLGSWASREKIRDYIGQRSMLTARDFAVMKWLRVPVLDPTLDSAVRKGVLSNPCNFLKAWLNDEGLPDCIKPHGHIGGPDSVIRHFVWNDFPSAHANEAITLDGSWDNVYQEDQCITRLTGLVKISPILLWKGMEQCLNRYQSRFLKLLDRFIHLQVDLLPTSSEQQLDFRLRGLAKQTLRATGITETRLDEILRERFESMRKKVWHPLDKNTCRGLLRLGETDSGRRYLSARMGRYWLDLAGV